MLRLFVTIAGGDDCTIRNENQSQFFFLFTWYNVLSRLPTKK
jgi:hypothetical protein